MGGSSALCSRGQEEKPFAESNNTEVHAFWRWGFHNSSLPYWGICSGSLHKGEIPSPPWSAQLPWESAVGDELLKWEGSGALSVRVECV